MLIFLLINWVLYPVLMIKRGNCGRMTSCVFVKIYSFSTTSGDPQQVLYPMNIIKRSQPRKRSVRVRMENERIV